MPRSALRIALLAALAGVAWPGHGPGTLSAGTADGGPTADPPSRCRIHPVRSVEPAAVPLGESVLVQVHLAFECPPEPVPMDVALVIDRSPSMKGAPLDDAKTAALAFLDATDLEINRVAVIAFSDRAEIVARASHDVRYLRSAVRDLEVPHRGGTDIAAGLREAGRALSGAGGRPDAPDVIVLLSDGRNGLGWAPVLGQASLRRAEGYRVITIALGIGADVALLHEVAGRAEDAWIAPRSRDLAVVFGSIAAGLESVLVRQLSVLDIPAEPLAYVVGSSEPAAGYDGSRLNWDAAAVEAGRFTVSYRVLPLRSGRHPVSDGGEASVLDALGRRRSVPLPGAEVLVWDPGRSTAAAPTTAPATITPGSPPPGSSATPTAPPGPGSSTPAATPTEEPTPTGAVTPTTAGPVPTVDPTVGRVFMPIAFARMRLPAGEAVGAGPASVSRDDGAIMARASACDGNAC